MKRLGEVRRGLRAAGELACDGLAAALLSSPCAACGRVALRIRTGAVCEECWRNVPFLAPPLCARCGAPLSRIEAEGHELADRCPCEDLPHATAMARAVGPYEGVLRSAVHALKYERRRSIAAHLAQLALEHCRPVLEGATAVVPVPLHPRRRWTRGFNQAEEIARHLPLPLWRVLRRARHTAPQAELTERQRAQNVRDAFRPRLFARRRRMGGARLVLFDDVCTTGATLSACAKILRDMGAGEVRALTIARTLRADRIGS